jgi:hypothetical protein
VSRVFFKRHLFVSLDDVSVLAKGEALANLEKQRADLEEEKRAVVAAASAKIKAKVAEIDALALVVRERREEQPVECFNEHRLEERVCITIRADTLEEVERRGLTTEEIEDLQQPKLFKGDD